MGIKIAETGVFSFSLREARGLEVVRVERSYANPSGNGFSMNVFP